MLRTSTVLLTTLLPWHYALSQDSATVHVDVDASRAVVELEPFWASQIIHPTESLLTERGKKLLDLVANAGAARQHIRIYNQPEVAIRVAPDGEIHYDWCRFDEMAKSILATGNKLKVVFFGMPYELAAHPLGSPRYHSGQTSRARSHLWKRGEGVDVSAR
jgi:hypothetical protein